MKLQHCSVHPSGFIALITASIISAVLFLSVISVSTFNFFSRSNILDYELKLQTREYAWSCLEMTILRLGEDSDYQVLNEPIILPGNSAPLCTIVSIKRSANLVVDTISESESELSSELETTLTLNDLTILKNRVMR